MSEVAVPAAPVERRLSGLCGEAFVTGFSGAAMPGPVLVATLALALVIGCWAGPLVVLGHFILEVTLVLALSARLARWLSSPTAPLVRGIGLVGGVMLWLMAFDMVRSLPHLSLRTLPTTSLYHNPIQAGLLLSAVNPYFWLWWATIGLGLLTRALAQRGRPGLVAFYTGHILSDLAWYSLVAALMAGGGRLLGDGVYRGLIAICAASLVFFGARFVAAGLRRATA